MFAACGALTLLWNDSNTASSGSYPSFFGTLKDESRIFYVLKYTMDLSHATTHKATGAAVLAHYDRTVQDHAIAAVSRL